MTERLFCVIAQQPCGIDGQGDGQGGCGACELSDGFLRDVFEMLEPRGAQDFWTRNEGETLVAGYQRDERKIEMKLRRGDTIS